MSTHLQKYAVKTVKSRDIMSIFLMFSVHRKQTPFVVVGSLKNYENLHDLGWYRRRLCGDFPTVFLYEVGACADPGIFVPENSSDNFFSPQLYRGCPMVISNKTIYVYFFFYFFFFFWGGGGGVQMLISIETHTAYDFPGGSGPPTPSGSAWGDCACAHAHLLSLRCLQMRQVHGCVLSRETLAMSK